VKLIVVSSVGLSDGAEAYLSDPRFNRGASATLTLSVTVIGILTVN